MKVEKSITVSAPQARAFSVFAERMSSWWPMDSHTIGEQAMKDVVIEPRAGGRWYELGEGGAETVWGAVAVYEPPEHLVLIWQLDADWAYDPDLRTELEVRFIAEGESKTRVELEHRGLEAYGDREDEVRSALDSEGGWNGLLATYGRITSLQPGPERSRSQAAGASSSGTAS
jgi:uncharacterized protein YndB with AHSA1/START domain